MCIFNWSKVRSMQAMVTSTSCCQNRVYLASAAIIHRDLRIRYQKDKLWGRFKQHPEDAQLKNESGKTRNKVTATIRLVKKH